jgi:hypothetical protein
VRFLRRFIPALLATLALAWAAEALIDRDAAVAALIFGTVGSLVFAAMRGGGGGGDDGGSDSGGWGDDGGSDGGGDGGGE